MSKSHKDKIFQPLSEKEKKKTPPKPAKAKSDWVSLRPVPSDAADAPEVHSVLKKPSVIYTYKDKNSQLLGYIYRFETQTKKGEKSKEFRPLTYRENSKIGVRKWGFYGWDTPRPLYGLDVLAQDPDRPVLICEGEKAADAARGVIGDDWAVITSPNGAGSVAKCDWSAVYGRPITIWPDHDEGGVKYVLAIICHLIEHDPKCEIWVVDIPEDKPRKWDAADGVSEGMVFTDMLQFVQNVSPCAVFLADHTQGDEGQSPEGGTGGDGSGNDSKKSGGRVNKTTQLIEMSACCELWHDDDVTYVSAPVQRGGKDFLEHMPINSRKFRRWLAGRYYFETDGLGVASEKNVNEAILVLAARALYEGAEYTTHYRVYHQDDEIWIDLVNDTRQTVHITPEGWQLVASFDCPVKFIRPSILKALPVPIGGQSLEFHLGEKINTSCDEDYMLIVSWILGCFHLSGPMPLLSLTGTTGSGKSGLHKMLIKIVDPQKAPGRRLPQDVRDLSIIASQTHLTMFDNVKSIPAWLSDDLSSLTTGGGFVTRVLTTDNEIMALEMRRPILINGIGGIGGQADLISRGIAVEIPKLKQRKTERMLKFEFERDWPYILGAIYDALSAGLKNFDDSEQDDDPEIRMFDFYKWILACQSSLDWPDGKFRQALKGNIEKSFHRVVDIECVAAAIVRHIDTEFIGTASKLLEFLNAKMKESEKRNRAWPKTNAAMGTAVKRVESALAQGGYMISRGIGRKAREITIIPPSSSSYFRTEAEKLNDELDKFNGD